MAFDLHKYYPPAMHLGQEMKSFICNGNRWFCQEKKYHGPIDPVSSTRQYTHLCHSHFLQEKVQLGFHLAQLTEPWVFWGWGDCLFVLGGF